MPRITLNSIHDKLEIIESEVKELKKTKVGTETWLIQHQQIKDDIADVKAEIATWRFYARWALLVVAFAIMSALLGLVIKK
jgi:hypothetical protein